MSDVPEERWAKAVWADCYRYGFQKYIKSIRDVIRFTNVFTLKYELLKDETDPVDLLGLTLLQVFEPLIYSRIPHYKELLCGKGNNYSYERQKEDEGKIKKALSIIVPWVYCFPGLKPQPAYRLVLAEIIQKETS